MESIDIMMNDHKNIRRMMKVMEAALAQSEIDVET